MRLDVPKPRKKKNFGDLFQIRDIDDFDIEHFADFQGFSSFNLQNQEFLIQRFVELSWNLPGKQVRLWESRDSELSGTSEIFKIGPIAKKLRDFKVG